MNRTPAVKAKSIKKAAKTTSTTTVVAKKKPRAIKNANKNEKSTNNVQADLKAANEKIAVLENRLNTFIEVVYREMKNDLERGPKTLSKKIAQAGLLT